MTAASALTFATMVLGADYGAPPPPAYGATTTSSSPTPASFPTPVPTPTECPFLCVDYINECGRWYGGCFENCPGEPWPTFEDPGCPTTTTESVPGVITSDPPGVTPVPLPSPIDEYPPPGVITSDPPGITPVPLPSPIEVYPPGTTTTCTDYICADYINSCGIWYGGCYYDCPGSTTPSFTDPGCPSTTTAGYETITTTSEQMFSILPIGCGTICDTRTDACGNTYGPGCWTSCSSTDTEPTFATPACNLEATATPVTY